MNTKILFPLIATSLLAVAAAPVLVGDSSTVPATASPHIVDLPAITMRPAQEDAAYYQAHKIVDLATITVYPDVGDLAFFVADTARLVNCLLC